jgi:hypothetical protein
LRTNRWGHALRRFATVIVASALALGTGAGAAFAFDDGGNPGTTGPNTITWTGHGTDISAQDCSAANEPNGQPANTPYLLWVLTTDGGSIAADSVSPHFLPVLHLSGSGSGDYNPGDGSTAGALKHFVTPYFTPDVSALHANVSMYVTSPGNGAWNLNISHGCAPPTQVQARAPTVTKNAAGAYTTKYGWTVQKSVDNKEIDVAPGGNATFNYTVTVTRDNGTNSNVQVGGTIHVSNPNSVAIGNPNVSDQLSDGVNCNLNAPSSLAPGDNAIPYTCQIPASQFDPTQPLSNTVTVSWAGQTLSDGSQLAAGNANYTVNNIQFQQSLVDSCVNVSDPQAPAGTFTNPVCATPASGTQFTYSVTHAGGDQNNPAGTCTPYSNTATITSAGGNDNGTVLGQDSQDVKVCVGADLQVTKDATPSFTRTYGWNITKAVDNGPVIKTAGSATANYTVLVGHDAGTDSNWQVTGTVHVTNPNDWEDITLASSQGLTDQIDNGGQCSFNGGDPSGTVIKAGATADFPYTCTYSQAPGQSAFTNTATASWDQNAASTADGSAQGTATGDFANASPKIVDGSVSVDDTLGGHLGIVNYTDTPNPFPFHYSVTFPNDKAGTCTTHNNTATFVTDDNGITNDASASVQVCVGADLQVAKNATASFNRTYLWSISKQGDKTTIDPGGTVNYTVGVNQTGVKDSGWQVNGTITVTNPNDWESVTAASVSDSIDNGGNCTVQGGSNVQIPASSAVTLPYSCTFGQQPASNGGTNLAFAMWDSGAASTPNSAAQGDAPYAFTTPTRVTNQTIHVTDSQGGALGTVTATDPPAAPASKTFNYSKTFAPPSSGCTTINNIATITETSQNAKFAVQDCSLGALTMGYWQNKNGQAAISKAPAGLGSYLYGFAPFKDLTGAASATNAQVASYFLSVFSAANASGNGAPMLKAQMLATALDAYLWQQIGAPAPIGAATINTSAWSSAFGGATSMTVSQMLSYAAGQWNSGNPYGGNKTLTTTAISAFNAINNNQVTGA